MVKVSKSRAAEITFANNNNNNNNSYQGVHSKIINYNNDMKVSTITWQPNANREDGGDVNLAYVASSNDLISNSQYFHKNDFNEKAIDVDDVGMEQVASSNSNGENSRNQVSKFDENIKQQHSDSGGTKKKKSQILEIANL